MKRNIGTVVLFALLVLTVAALTRIDAPRATTVGTFGEVKHSN